MVQWIGFVSASGHAYENAPQPDAAGGHWALMRYPFASAGASEPGQCFAIHGWRDEGTVLCWAAPA